MDSSVTVISSIQTENDRQGIIGTHRLTTILCRNPPCILFTKRKASLSRKISQELLSISASLIEQSVFTINSTNARPCELFSREIITEIHYDHCPEFPWADDTIIRGVVCEGRKILQTSTLVDKFTFEIIGDAKNVQSECNIEIGGNVSGGCKSGGDINIEGSVSGGCMSNRNTVIAGHLSGGANAGYSITVGGNLSGGCNTGTEISCGGNLSGDVNCGGTVKVAGDVEAEKIKGNVVCNSLKCEKIEGDVTINKEN